MTGTFTNITALIDSAEDDKTVAPIIFEALVYCESVVTDKRYRMKEWSKKMERNGKVLWRLISGSIIWKLRSYFSDVHDLDHATNHNAFQPGGYRIIRQLKYLLGNNRAVKKYDFRTLFRESPLAREYFNDRYYHIGYGVWDKKVMIKNDR